MAKEIGKLVEGTENVEENVEVDSSTLRKNDNPIDPGTRLEPKSDKESSEGEREACIGVSEFKFERLHVATTPYYESEPGSSTLGNQEQSNNFDFWTDSYATDDDELPTKKVSQELMDEMSQTVDEARLRKVADEMLRQQCTSGDEHQYHIDQMQNS
ncbi:hypothetical protein Tco_0061148 [Tanacetum coccineum]